jgi:penicillin-insensitive murein endopeptidase
VRRRLGRFVTFLLAVVFVSPEGAAVRAEGEPPSAPAIRRARAPRPRAEQQARAPRSTQLERCASIAPVEPPWCPFVPPPPRGQSIGLPYRGRLNEGVFLSPGGALRHLAIGASEARYFGSRALVTLVRAVASRIDAVVPGARLAVGELSARKGGDLRGHRSHENGRDVDLGFFVVDETGRSVELPSLARIHFDGTIEYEDGRYAFDPARNWLLVQALLESDAATVQHIFTHERVRAMLLDEARRQGAPEEIVRRARQVLHQPHGHVTPHANHFHIRIYCAPSDGPKCVDVRPYWPWAEGVGEGAEG